PLVACVAGAESGESTRAPATGAPLESSTTPDNCSACATETTPNADIKNANIRKIRCMILSLNSSRQRREDFVLRPARGLSVTREVNVQRDGETAVVARRDVAGQIGSNRERAGFSASVSRRRSTPHPVAQRSVHAGNRQ